MKPIIEVNHVWKEYQKGIDRRYKSLRDTLVAMPRRLMGEQKEKFWALEDIDFKVEAGESVGIIGRNGAGKSTLLKILSRITPPTKGEIILRGRVASLLEVGTGFHPELTGRENVYFNGSILGMKNQEIKRKFDEIVDFSGVGSFIDTPLKHYSSGMQMRLAFSVAAHLDSEILLIDEVLAVGDAEFQKKCIGKMDEVSKGEGKTIIFVSHDMAMIQNICNNSLMINQGKITCADTTNVVIGKFQKSLQNSTSELGNVFREGDGKVIVSKIEINNFKDQTKTIAPGDEVSIDFHLYSEKEIMGKLDFAIGIDNQLSQRLAIINSEWKYEGFKFHGKNRIIRFIIKDFPFKQGVYILTTHCSLNGIVTDWVKKAVSFDVYNSDFYGVEKMVPDHNGNFLLNFEALLI